MSLETGEDFELLIAELTHGKLMPRGHPFDVLAANDQRLQTKTCQRLSYPPHSLSGQWAFNFHRPLQGAWDRAILGGWTGWPPNPTDYPLYIFDVPATLNAQNPGIDNERLTKRIIKGVSGDFGI